MSKLTKAQQNVVIDLAEGVVSNSLIMLQCRDRSTNELGDYIARLEPVPGGGVQATPLAKMIENPFSQLEPTGVFRVLDLVMSK